MTAAMRDLHDECKLEMARLVICNIVVSVGTMPGVKDRGRDIKKTRASLQLASRLQGCVFLSFWIFFVLKIFVWDL